MTLKQIRWLLPMMPLALMGVVYPADAYSLQRLLGLERSHTRYHLAPSNTAAVELTPISQDGLRWAAHLGGEIQPDGSFARPINVHELYGINSLADGVYTQRFLWEADRIAPQPTRLADGTVYYSIPQNTVRGWENSRPIFYHFRTDASAIQLQVSNNQVRSISYCYYVGYQQVCR